MLAAFVTKRGEAFRTAPDGSTARAHWDEAARRGSEYARALLDGWPEYPESLAYLDGWYQDISAGRREGMYAIAPLTWSDIDAWIRRTGVEPYPHESRALLTLDAAFRSGLREKDDTKPVEDQIPIRRPAWPTKKEEA